MVRAQRLRNAELKSWLRLRRLDMEGKFMDKSMKRLQRLIFWLGIQLILAVCSLLLSES